MTSKNRIDGSSIAIERSIAGQLLMIHIANIVDQSSQEDGSPALWLGTVFKLVSLALRLDIAVPPILLGLRTLTEDEERDLLDTYANLSFENIDDIVAKVARFPNIAELRLLLSLWAISNNDKTMGRENALDAFHLISQWASPWDKRLESVRWLSLASYLESIHGSDDISYEMNAARITKLFVNVECRLDKLYLELDRRGLLPTYVSQPDVYTNGGLGVDSGDHGLPPRFASFIRRLRNNDDDPRMQYYPNLPSLPLHDKRLFPVTALLEENARSIAAEYAAIDPRALHRESEPIKRTGNWDVLMLYERGWRRDENCSKCPITSSILDRSEVVHGAAGLAYFSRLAPHTRVEPHRGPTNIRVRCHLGLVIPDHCKLIVDDKELSWRQNECVVFDDSFLHSVSNDSDEARVVLVVDLWHPDLAPDEIELLDGWYRSTFAQIENLSTYWRDNERALANARIELN